MGSPARESRDRRRLFAQAEKADAEGKTLVSLRDGRRVAVDQAEVRRLRGAGQVAATYHIGACGMLLSTTY